jgi:hypothetical protein
MHRYIFFIATFFLGLGATLASAQQTITQDELLRRSQELFDAVIPGNQEPWKKYYAEDCIYADEKGRNLNKAALVADITPLPKGYSGAIKVVRPQSRIFGDTAILSFDLDETETIFGQHLKARYHEIDTWLRRNGVWQIVATQAFRYYEDPGVGKTDRKRFPELVGTYELAPGQTRTVTADGDNLFVERNGKHEQLFPESCDIFFRKGVEGRILFRADDTGKVNTLIDRRNNEDVVWQKRR